MRGHARARWRGREREAAVCAGEVAHRLSSYLTAGLPLVLRLRLRQAEAEVGGGAAAELVGLGWG